MRIPVGNFGDQQQRPVGIEPVNTAGSAAIERAGQNIAAGFRDVALAGREKQRELARAKSANAMADHELAVDQAAFDVKRRVLTGELPYTEAQKTFDDAVGQMQPPKIDGADPLMTEALSRGMKKANAAGGLSMQGFVLQKERDDYKGQYIQFLDTKAKQAGLPGADIESINEVGAKTALALAQKAGLSSADTERSIQNWKDQNWYNNAREKAIAVRGDMAGLHALEKDLASPDGFYQGKLDTEKRDALLSQVTNQRLQLENRMQMQADRADVRAQRTLYQIDQQISTGVPARAEQWDTWSASVKGTQYEEEFKQRLADERQVQEVLRLPLDQQAAYVQEKHAALMQGGGDVREIANLSRLQTAVTANIKQLQEQPLDYAQARTGVEIPPLDLSQLVQPGGGEALVAQLHDRVDTINALQKQYGGRVQMKPLTDSEAMSLGEVFSKLGPQQKVDALAKLRDGVGAAVMVPMMKQVAKDDPMLAAASGLTAAQSSRGRNVARVALLGDELLKSKQVTIPSDAKLNEEFQSYVGNAITTVPGKQAAMQVTNAIYAQLNAENGDYLTKDSTFNASRYRQAIRLATGGIVDYNGGKVLPVRYGSTEAETKTALRAVTPGQVKLWGGVPGMTDEQAAQFIRDAQLESVGFGRYRVRAGAGLLPSNNGQPLEMVFP